jgi:hypothetical protein
LEDRDVREQASLDPAEHAMTQAHRVCRGSETEAPSDAGSADLRADPPDDRSGSVGRVVSRPLTSRHRDSLDRRPSPALTSGRWDDCGSKRPANRGSAADRTV